MSSELSILALFGLLVIVTVFLQVLLAVPQVGIPYLSSPRDDAKPLTGPAGRAVRAVENSAITLAMFAPAILLLAVQDKFTAATLLAAQIFLLARIAFVVLYLAGLSYVRTAVWIAGILSTAFLYLQAM